MAHMQTDELLQLITEVAAQVITPRFRALGAAEIDEKSPGDYVTVADREAEVLITAALLARSPRALVVGEEAAHADPGLVRGLASAEHAYTVDPVDGTTNFVRGSPRYAVMVAELRRGEVTRSWIWQPEMQVAYVAERGAGLYRNEVRVSRPDAPLPPRGATTRRSWRHFESFGQLDPVLDTNYCAGFDYSQLVDGEVDYFTYLRPKPWDHLPGSLMLDEIGGASIDAQGQPYGPSTGAEATIITASSPELARQVAGFWRPAPRG